MFDALLFPLLILDGCIFVLCGLYAVSLAELVGFGVGTAGGLLLTIVISVLVDWMLIRRAWRAVSKPLPAVQ